MGSSKPKVMQTPFRQDTQQTNTYAPFSIADTPEAQSFLNTPLDFGDPVDVDPGIGRRTMLDEQDAENRYQSAFNAGTPAFIRQAALAREKRDIRGRGAYETQQARYLNQQGNNAIRERRTMADLARRQTLLPQFFQTGGTANTSGFNSQVVQPQPGFWQRLALQAAGGAGSTISAIRGGG